MPKALKSCPKTNKWPNLVTLSTGQKAMNCAMSGAATRSLCLRQFLFVVLVDVVVAIIFLHLEKDSVSGKCKTIFWRACQKLFSKCCCSCERQREDHFFIFYFATEKKFVKEICMTQKLNKKFWAKNEKIKSQNLKYFAPSNPEGVYPI